jgi:UDP-N-acetylglucosamine 2-epimerase (non-hydrolysing)
VTAVKRVMVAFGTRPEAIKMAPVIFALRETPGIEVLVQLTGQHREQLDSALRVFGITGDMDLDVMLARQSLPELAARVIEASAGAIRAHRPEYVIVHGDTLSAFCVAMTAFLERVPVAHVEAGLRSGVLLEPFPEEASRRLVDELSDLDFAPTPLAARNLEREGKDPERILVTGQTAVDSIQLAADLGTLPAAWAGQSLVTLTMHRRESWPNLGSLAAAIASVARRHPEHLFVYPMHMNPVVREAVQPVLGDIANVALTEPLDYGEMAALMAASRLIVTDSGGMIEEGVSLGVHVVILRNVTERPEGIELGLATLAGTEPAEVERIIEERLRIAPSRPAGRVDSPYGDGRASRRVAQGIAWRLGLAERPSPWVPTMRRGSEDVP